MDGIQTDILKTTVGTLHGTEEVVWERTARDGTLQGRLLGSAVLALQAGTQGFFPVARVAKRIRRKPQRPVWDVMGSRKMQGRVDESKNMLIIGKEWPETIKNPPKIL